MKYYLVYRDDVLGDAFKRHFGSISAVEVIKADITEVVADAISNPANSFGFMGGGLDLLIVRRFGHSIEQEMQKMIKERPLGELLVGEALIVPTGDKDISYLISAPTMRVPACRDVANSVNAYLAMKAILIAAMSHPDIETVSIPGLCTGSGAMPPDVAAHQMFMAFSEIVLKESSVFNDAFEARRHHLMLLNGDKYNK